MKPVVTKYWGAADVSCSALMKAQSMNAEEIISLLDRSGLAGRGGAGFSCAENLRTVLQNGGTGYVVANLSNCDNDNDIVNSMVRNDAVSLVEGAAIAAYATGARKIILFMRNTQRGLVETVEKAIAAVKAVFPSLNAAVHVGESDYEKGQSQIILKILAGGVPVTECDKKHAAEAGLDGLPTLYHSAETLACVAAVLRGEYEDTRLIQVLDKQKKFSKVLEVPTGTTIAEALEQAGAPTEDLKVVTVGGYMGIVLKPSQLSLPLTPEALKKEGGMFGNLILQLVHRGTCMVDFLFHCYEESARECCGRCVYGRLGTAQIRQILRDISARRCKPDDMELMKEIAEAMEQACSCNQGKTAAHMILSGIKNFSEESEAHSRKKTCPENVCRGYVSYHIDPVKCTGCEECRTACPAKAIEGRADYIHVIDDIRCTGCRKCIAVCGQNAIIVAGKIKPKGPEEPIPVGSWGKNGSAFPHQPEGNGEKRTAPHANRYAKRSRYRK